MDDNLSSKLLKIADDTNVLRTVHIDADKGTLPDDLTNLVKSSEKWQMLLDMVM